MESKPMIDEEQGRSRESFRFARAIGAFGLSLCIASALMVPFGAVAHADVRASDLILNEYTIEASGASASFFPNVDSNFASLIDGDGNVYFSRNTGEQTKIASITKVMTAMVAIEHRGNIADITVSEKAATVGESTAGLKAGDRISFDDALLALMVPSGNDAAIALAETVGATIDPTSIEVSESDAAYGNTQGVDIAAQLSSGDPEQIFVALMNLKAIALGCTDTIFTNPHGLDGGNFGETMHSCVNDVVLMARTAMESEEFRDLVDDPKVTILVRNAQGEISEVELESTDLLLGSFEGACGIKTGNTELAGPCLASACERSGTMLYATLLDSTSEEQRFVDAQNLYNWYFDHWVDYPLAHSSQTTTMTVGDETREVPVVAQVSHHGWIDKTFNATFEDPDQTIEVFSLRGNVSQSIELFDITGNVSVGDVVGEATFYQDNQEIATVKIVACEAVAAPNLFEGIGVWWNRLWRSADEASAQTVIMNETPLIFDKAI